MLELSGAEFLEITTLLERSCGIHLCPGKEELVRSRLSQRLRQLGMASYAEYLGHVARDATQRELLTMIDLLTTNKTSMFREAPHFDHLRDTILPRWGRRGGPFRVWSAGCSTGEEAYSLAIVLREALGDAAARDVRILATDISDSCLATAREGIYAPAVVTGLDQQRVARHFEHSELAGDPALRVRDEVRAPIAFARLNLIDEWPLTGPFQAIFCRNVMIYFDGATRQRLVGRFHDLLTPDGCLFIGHSESLGRLPVPLSFIGPGLYERRDPEATSATTDPGSQGAGPGRRQGATGGNPSSC